MARYPDGSTYTGDFVDGVRQGQGEIVMPDGFRYNGQWQGGEMTGKGTATYGNRDVYEGEFVKGKREGLGQADLCDRAGQRRQMAERHPCRSARTRTRTRTGGQQNPPPRSPRHRAADARRKGALAPPLWACRASLP